MNLALLKVAVIKQGTEYDDDRNGYIYHTKLSLLQPRKEDALQIMNSLGTLYRSVDQYDHYNRVCY